MMTVNLIKALRVGDSNPRDLINSIHCGLIRSALCISLRRRVDTILRRKG